MGFSGRLLLGFGAASLASVATGALVCALSDIPSSLWIRNLAGWALGAGAAAGLAAAFRPMLLTTALLLAPAALLASFLGPDQSGVHRWIELGPLSLNAAMLLLPSAVVALAVMAQSRAWPWIAVFASLALLVAQPDASQATALAAAMAAVALTIGRPLVRLGLIATAAALAGASWLRPDPLAPVPEVEGVIALAAGLSPLLAGLALMVLPATAAAPLLAARMQAPRSAAVALSVFLAASAAAPFLGAYPVPLVGVGLSPILGAWLAVGLLAGLTRPSA